MSSGSLGVNALHPERTPDRPGPGATPEAVLRALDLTVRRRVEGLLAGEHRSASLGAGTELAQVRLYQPGDDVRQIDWNVTARTGEPHVRVHVAERILVSWLALDVSPSMRFGTADRRKIDVAEGVALALGYAATRRGNRLGVVSFGGPETETVPPRQGRVGLLGMLTALRSEPVHEGVGATSVGSALSHLARIARSRAFVAVVSDFRGPRDWKLPLAELASRHDVVAMEVRDPREMELPNVGDLWAVDPETGRQIHVDTGSRKLRERFRTAAAEERASLAATLRSVGVDHIVLETRGDWLRVLAGFLKLRSASGQGGKVSGARGLHGLGQPSSSLRPSSDPEGSGDADGGPTSTPGSTPGRPAGRGLRAV